MLGIQFVPDITKLVCADDVIRYAMWYFIGLMCAEYTFAENEHVRRRLLICATAFGVGVLHNSSFAKREYRFMGFVPFPDAFNFGYGIDTD